MVEDPVSPPSFQRCVSKIGRGSRKSLHPRTRTQELEGETKWPARGKMAQDARIVTEKRGLGEKGNGGRYLRVRDSPNGLSARRGFGPV